MKWLTFEIQKTPGFRFNLIDLLLIVFLVAVSIGLFVAIPGTSVFWVPLYLGFSFFLFCNVFRIGNRLEPWWYVPFFCVSVYALLAADSALFWWSVLLGLEPLKWGLIVFHILKRPYHGAFCRTSGNCSIRQAKA